ncbi:hypothetical protein HDU93_003354 [Gonapodya sp. JEL0774]|nr:hypothetical protein HDU93_003354 [Gonapodya sp. JEL0774]
MTPAPIPSRPSSNLRFSWKTLTCVGLTVIVIATLSHINFTNLSLATTNTTKSIVLALEKPRSVLLECLAQAQSTPPNLIPRAPHPNLEAECWNVFDAAVRPKQTELSKVVEPTKPVQPRPTWPIPLHDSTRTIKGEPIPSADGKPRKFWFDLGMNVGDTMYGFVKGHPDAAEFVKIGFECNPALRERLLDAAQKLDFTYFDACVSDNFTPQTFYVDDPNHGSKEGLPSWGSSVVDWGGLGANRTKVEVAMIDFSSFIREYVHPDDYVIVKMDVEGAEYPVLRKMFLDGTFCLLDSMALEDHHFGRDEAIAEYKHRFDIGRAARYFGSADYCNVTFDGWH